MSKATVVLESATLVGVYSLVAIHAYNMWNLIKLRREQAKTADAATMLNQWFSGAQQEATPESALNIPDRDNQNGLYL